jgi:hypothetical protein
MEIRYRGDWKILGPRNTSGAEGAVRSILPNLHEIALPFAGVFKRAA